MPSIHPSESPELGWLVPCLAVADIRASIDWYAKLDLVLFGGDPAENWAMLRNRAVEIHLFQGHITSDLLNFRGGKLPTILAFLGEHGLEVRGEGEHASRTYTDPDGREVFFDSSPEEDQAYPTGQPLTRPVSGDVHDGEGLDLGNLTCCFACESLRSTMEFYLKLGMVRAGGEPDQGWAILSRADHVPMPGERQVATYLSLFEGLIPTDTLNLRGGNVGEIAAVLEERGVDLGEGVKVAEDGGECLLLEDPDGRPVFLDTTPPERLYD